MPGNKNENWGVCPECGAPVLINPKTSTAEPCSICASRASRWGLFLGSYGILLAVVVVALILYVSIRMLLG
jgi:hypothetical protein